MSRPVYTPETEAKRRAGDLRLRLTPERAASLRALAKARGLTLVALVSEWIDAFTGVSRKSTARVDLPLALARTSTYT